MVALGPPQEQRLVDVQQADAYDALGALASGTVNLVCTSPPYWGQRTYGQEAHFDRGRIRKDSGASRDTAGRGYEAYRDDGGMLGMEPFPEWYVAHLAEIFHRAWDPLAADGSLWINLGDTYFARWSSVRSGRQGLAGPERTRRRTPSGGWRHDKQLLLLPARFAIAMQERGWILRNDLIWAKPNVGPRPETDRLRLSHEHFFHFVKRQKSSRPRYWYDLQHAEARGFDVVQQATSRQSVGHPATYPKELVRPRVLSSCPPDGLVLDPFCGSGTTLEVAVEEGRDALGFDITDTYVAATRERLGLAPQAV